MPITVACVLGWPPLCLIPRNFFQPRIFYSPQLARLLRVCWAGLNSAQQWVANPVHACTQSILLWDINIRWLHLQFNGVKVGMYTDRQFIMIFGDKHPNVYYYYYHVQTLSTRRRSLWGPSPDTVKLCEGPLTALVDIPPNLSIWVVSLTWRYQLQL